MTLALLTVALAVATLLLPPAFVSALVGTISPALVAFIAHSAAPAWAKRVLGGLIAAVVGVVVKNTMADGSAVFSLTTACAALLAFIAQQLAYANVWKYLGMNRWKWLLPALGLGKPR